MTKENKMKKCFLKANIPFFSDESVA